MCQIDGRCLVLAVAAVLWTSVGQCEQPAAAKKAPNSNMVLTVGDPALSREMAAKLSARGGLFSETGTVVGNVGSATPAAVQRPPLTNESLQQMLENLGYEAKMDKLTTGETTFSLVLKRGTWTLRPTVALTVDGKMLAIMHYVTNKIDNSKVDAARFQKLLESNATSAPNCFAIVPASQQLILYHAERNMDITPAMLRQWLDQSVDVVIGTYDHWKGLDSPAAMAQ